MAVPEILSNAPAWASDAFWLIVVLGAGGSAVARFVLGNKTEGDKIEKTGKPTPTHAIMSDTSSPGIGAGAMQVLGGALAERHQAQASIEAGAAIAEALQELSEKIERLTEVAERMALSTEKEAHRAEVLEEARRMARQLRDEERDRDRP